MRRPFAVVVRVLGAELFAVTVGADAAPGGRDVETGAAVLEQAPRGPVGFAPTVAGPDGRAS